MSLTVTVQKGHDFSSGNVTRAALNAGAVPTVAVTGSVGTSELAAGSVTGTELKSSSSVDADRAVATNHIQDDAVTTAKIADNAVDLTKLDYPGNKGAIVKLGDTAEAGTVIPETMETRLAGKILIGDGVDLLSLGDQSGNVEDTTVVETQPKSHVAIGIEARDSAPSTGVLLTLKDFAIKVVKLAKNKVAGALTPGIIVYDNVGVASVLASTNTESSVLTTNTTSTPSFKISNKIVDVKNPLDSSITETTDSTGYISQHNIFVAAHGITSGTPIITGMFFECTSGPDNGYATGDRYYDIKGYDLDHEAYFFVEGDNVGVYLQYQPKSYTKEDAFQGTPTGRAYLTPSKWKVCVTVSEV